MSTVSVFALSVFVGLSSATVTLTSQARGAGDSAQAAYWLHRGLLIHGLVAVPITLLLLMLEPSLRLMGQDAELAHVAGEYCMLLLPGMWAWEIKLETYLRVRDKYTVCTVCKPLGGEREIRTQGHLPRRRLRLP